MDALWGGGGDQRFVRLRDLYVRHGGEGAG